MSGEPPREEEVSYLREMLSHPANLSALCSSLILGSATLVAGGVFSWSLLPVIGYLGAAGIASLFVPDSPVFREYVDRKKRSEARERQRQHLLAELNRLAGSPSSPGGDAESSEDHWARYRRMRERFESIRRLAAGKGAALTAYDLEKLDDATVDYLRLFHARLVMRDRIRGNDPEETRAGLRRIEKQLAEARSPSDRIQMERARADLQRIAERHESLKVRDTAAAASLLSMSDAFEEVYQHVLSNPRATGMSDYLGGVVERFAIERSLSLEVEHEVSRIGQPEDAPRPRPREREGR